MQAEREEGGRQGGGKKEGGREEGGREEGTETQRGREDESWHSVCFLLFFLLSKLPWKTQDGSCSLLS